MTTVTDMTTAAVRQCSEMSLLSVRCLTITTPGSMQAVTVLRYALDPPDQEVVTRGLLTAGWSLLGPAGLASDMSLSDPRWEMSVDESGRVRLQDLAGDLLFAGVPEEAVTIGWLRRARQQASVPVLVGVWGVDLGNDVDLAGCARAGKLLHGAARIGGS